VIDLGSARMMGKIIDQIATASYISTPMEIVVGMLYGLYFTL